MRHIVHVPKLVVGLCIVGAGVIGCQRDRAPAGEPSAKREAVKTPRPRSTAARGSTPKASPHRKAPVTKAAPATRPAAVSGSDAATVTALEAPELAWFSSHPLRKLTKASAAKLFRSWLKASATRTAPQRLHVELLKADPAGLVPVLVQASSTKTEKCKQSVVPKDEANDCDYFTEATIYFASFVNKGGRYTLAAAVEGNAFMASDQVELAAEVLQRGDFNDDGHEEYLLRLVGTHETIPAHGAQESSEYLLLEVKPGAIVQRFELDGGTSPLGTTLDGECTTSTCSVDCERECAVEVKITEHCGYEERKDGSCKESSHTERYAWSSKRQRWQVFSGIAAKAHVIVGATRPAGRAAMTPLSTDRVHELVRGWVKLAPGYPRLADSDDIEGLRPGHQLVLLGICPTRKAVNQLFRKMPARVRRGVRPYTRGIRGPAEEACPVVASGRE